MIQTPDAALKLCSKRGDIKQGGPVHLSPRSLDSHSADPDDTRLISSPYTNINNQLDLTTLDQASRLLAFALSILRPVRTDYANASYTDAFNWLEVFQLLASLCQQVGFQWVDRHFHVVVFRSQLREGINRDRLGLLDQKSHEEACASGGLLKYWFGSPDQERRNLATCLWSNHEAAAVGGRGPWHKRARTAAREMYEYIDFQTHELIIEADVGGWRIEN